MSYVSCIHGISISGVQTVQAVPGQPGMKMIVMSPAQAQAAAAGGKPITITVPGQQGGPPKMVTIQGKPVVSGPSSVLSGGQIITLPAGQAQVKSIVCSIA